MKKEHFYSNAIIRGGLGIAFILTLAEGVAQVIGQSSNEEAGIQTRRNGDIFLFRQETIGPYNGRLDVNFTNPGNGWVEGTVTLLADGSGRFMYDAIENDTKNLALFLGNINDPHLQPRLIAQHELFDFMSDGIISPAISPDSRYVAYIHTFVSSEADYLQNDVLIVPFQGGDPVLLAVNTDAEEVSWIPDGSGVIYSVYTRTGEAYFRIDIDPETGEFSQPYRTS